MELWQVIILGIVQGLTEFLPVSSSGHLLVLREMFGMYGPGLTLDIILHLGSLLAIFMVFWKDIWALVRRPFQKMTGLLIIGSLPVVVVGLFLSEGDLMEWFAHALFLAAAFTVTGFILIAADHFGRGDNKKTSDQITWLDALVVGLMQAIGIPPGISRSGATITGALARGISREAAARFSFMLALIAISGAGFLETVRIATGREDIGVELNTANVLLFVVGFAVSALVSYASIRLLLQLIKKCRLRYFSFYLFALAVLIAADHLVFGVFF